MLLTEDDGKDQPGDPDELISAEPRTALQLQALCCR